MEPTYAAKEGKDEAGAEKRGGAGKGGGRASGELEEEAMKRPRDKKKEGEEWRETKRQS